MTIKKITTGFVIQTFDTDQNKFVSQEFVAGNSEYEDKNGDTISLGDNEEADKTFFAKPGGEPYLPFDMVQPTDNGTMKELNYYVPYLNANEVDKLKKGMQSYFRFIKPEVTFDLRNKMLYIQLGDGIDPKKWIEIGAYVNGFYQNYLDGFSMGITAVGRTASASEVAGIPFFFKYKLTRSIKVNARIS